VAINEKAKKEKKAALEKPKGSNSRLLQANDNVTNRADQAPNDPKLPSTDSKLSNPSLKSHNEEVLDRIRTLTSESKKAAKDAGKT
jgi:hypothetical protein